MFKLKNTDDDKNKSGKVFYQFKLNPTESGISMWINKFISFHETPCYHYCLPEWLGNFTHPSYIEGKESMAQSLKRRGVKFSRIHKTCSRKAFDTKEKAYANFIFLKKRHLAHLERDIIMIKAVLDFHEKKTFDDLADDGHSLIFPDTRDIVLSNFQFD